MIISEIFFGSVKTKKIYLLNVVGIISKERKLMKTSIAIWKEDYTLVDLLQNVTDCDESGALQTTGTVFEESNEWVEFYVINDFNVLLGSKKTAFSLTDISKIADNSALFHSPYSDFSAKDINNSNTIIGDGSNDGSSLKAFAFIPITKD